MHSSASPDRADAARTAHQAIAFLRPHQVDAPPNLIESRGRPAEVVLEQDRLLDAGLVVMGALVSRSSAILSRPGDPHDTQGEPRPSLPFPLA